MSRVTQASFDIKGSGDGWLVSSADGEVCHCSSLANAKRVVRALLFEGFARSFLAESDLQMDQVAGPRTWWIGSTKA